MQNLAFISKIKKSDTERMRDICRENDQGLYEPDEEEYYKEVIKFIENKGKSKLQDRNKSHDGIEITTSCWKVRKSLA